MDGFHYSIEELKQFTNSDYLIYRRGAPFTFNSKLLL